MPGVRTLILAFRALEDHAVTQRDDKPEADRARVQRQTLAKVRNDDERDALARLDFHPQQEPEAA